MKIYLSSKIRPDRDNSMAINRVLETAKEGSTMAFPDGVYPIGSTIIQSNKVHWDGAGATELRATNPMTLVQLVKAPKSVISNINFKGSYSIWDRDKGDTFNGIEISSVVIMRDCLIGNAWGDGVHVSADINNRTNASHSRFDNMDIGECKGNGFYFRGGDANWCGVYNADIRDCNGIGGCDSSFLGCQWFNVMTHSNKGGSFRADDPNNRAGFYGCYCEHDQKPVYLGGCACWFGGLPSAGIILREQAKVFSYDSVKITN